MYEVYDMVMCNDLEILTEDTTGLFLTGTFDMLPGDARYSITLLLVYVYPSFRATMSAYP